MEAVPPLAEEVDEDREADERHQREQQRVALERHPRAELQERRQRVRLGVAELLRAARRRRPRVAKSAVIMTTISPTKTVATNGLLCVACVRPKTRGRMPSRPIAKM